MIPADAERYLRAVTRLLPPRVARQVRAELLGHLHQDMLDARLRGLDEAEAWAQALQEAGPVWPAAWRLVQVHTLGRALRVVLVGVALGGAAYAVQSGTTLPPMSQQAQP
ncbi:hypothetical protein ACFSC4_06665 [Deinococcus malanensis]|uniref:hypothetical protein n=1 Tax=Deinococcus malanensis TaxID=1706855 RepID=UPI001666D876|nr:hypothetical protein [Deinococcus malanensis]